MNITERNISALNLTLEPADFGIDSKISLDKFKEAAKTHYIDRINVPVECYQLYYDSELYKILRDNTDKKTKTKFYLIVDKMNGNKPEKVTFYFDTPNTSNW